MKKSVLFLFVLLSVLLCTPAVFAASPKKVAVYVEGPLSFSDKSLISSAVMSRISGNKEYVCFERNKDFMNALTKEQDYELSGDVPEHEIREVGERMGVDYVIVVNAKIKRDKTFMSCELLELVTGRVLKSVSGERDGDGIDVLKALATNCAYRLVSKKSK